MNSLLNNGVPTIDHMINNIEDKINVCSIYCWNSLSHWEERLSITQTNLRTSFLVTSSLAISLPAVSPTTSVRLLSTHSQRISGSRPARLSLCDDVSSESMATHTSRRVIFCKSRTMDPRVLAALGLYCSSGPSLPRGVVDVSTVSIDGVTMHIRTLSSVSCVLKEYCEMNFNTFCKCYKNQTVSYS